MKELIAAQNKLSKMNTALLLTAFAAEMAIRTTEIEAQTLQDADNKTAEQAFQILVAIKHESRKAQSEWLKLVGSL